MYAQQQQQQQPYSGHMGPDGASQQSMASRHAVLLSGLASARAHYAGQNNTLVYPSTTPNGALQVPAMIVNGTGPSVLEGRDGYGSTLQGLPNYTSADYSAATANGTGPSALEGRSGYGLQGLPNYTSADYPAATTANGTGPSVLEDRSGYGSTLQGLPNYTSADYPAATTANGTGPSVLEGRSGYGSTLQGLPNYTSAGYPAATTANGSGSSVLEGRSGYGSTLQGLPSYTSADYPTATTANGTGQSVLEGRGGYGSTLQGLPSYTSAEYPATTTANGTGPSVLEGRSGYGPTLQGLPSYTSAGYPAATTPNRTRPSVLEGRSGYGSTFQSLPSYTSVDYPAASTANASVLEGRSGYGSTLQGLPSYTSADHPVASQKDGQKVENMYPDKLIDYPLGDRPLYAERPSAYSRRELQNESTVRLADSVASGHQHQHSGREDINDRLDAAAARRQELLQAQPLQFASVDRSSRQGDYLAARTAAVRHAGQEILPYGGRMDADHQTLSIISGKQHAPSILRADPHRDVEDIVHAYSSGSYGYGVSLPPGRAYASGKGLHGTPPDSDYPGGILVRSGYARLDDRLADMEYAREIERREEVRHLEILRDRERERERQRERERERDRGGLSSAKAGRHLRRESPRVEASHRRRSPVQETRREYVSKGVPNRAREDHKFSLDTPIRSNQDFRRRERPTEHELPSTRALADDHGKLRSGMSRRNAKVVKTAKKSTDSPKKVLMVKQGRVKKKPGKGKGKKGAGKSTAMVTPTNPNPNSEPKPDSKVKKANEDKCYHCNMTGHWRRNCPQYLEELKKNKASGATTSGVETEKGQASKEV